MSFLGDALKTIAAGVLRSSKVETLITELDETDRGVRVLLGITIKLDHRLVRLETLEEVRNGTLRLRLPDA